MKGVVNWYSDRKGVGLIESEDGKNVMVYEKDIPFLVLLHAGDQVEYIVKRTPDGMKATKIKEIESSF